MGYLDPTEYVAWGLGVETSESWVRSASAMIDGYCRRTSLGPTQYVERLRFAQGSQRLQLSNAPLIATAPAVSALVNVRVRLGRPRRGVWMDTLQAEIAGTFALSGSWSTVNVSTVDVSGGGEITLSSHLFGLPYDEAEVTYTAGFVIIPDAVKAACAQIVRNAQAVPALNVKRSQVDGLQMEYFQNALIDESVRAMLRPYVAMRLG